MIDLLAITVTPNKSPLTPIACVRRFRAAHRTEFTAPHTDTHPTHHRTAVPSRADEPARPKSRSCTHAPLALCHAFCMASCPYPIPSNLPARHSPMAGPRDAPLLVSPARLPNEPPHDVAVGLVQHRKRMPVKQFSHEGRPGARRALWARTADAAACSRMCQRSWAAKWARTRWPAVETLTACLERPHASTRCGRTRGRKHWPLLEERLMRVYRYLFD